MNLEDMQAVAHDYRREQHVNAIRRAAIPPRRRTASPQPMAPLSGETLVSTLLSLDAQSIKLYVVLCSLTHENGLIHADRDALAKASGTCRSTVSRCTATLRANGLLQRQGRFGYTVRRQGGG